MIDTLTIGDTYDSPGTLTAGSSGAAYGVSGATEIRAAIVSANGTERLCSDVILVSSAPGANWAQGVIVFNFTPAITSEIGDKVKPEDFNANGDLPARLETQVEINGAKYTWTAPINLRMGMIA